MSSPERFLLKRQVSSPPVLPVLWDTPSPICCFSTVVILNLCCILESPGKERFKNICKLDLPQEVLIQLDWGRAQTSDFFFFFNSRWFQLLCFIASYTPSRAWVAGVVLNLSRPPTDLRVFPLPTGLCQTSKQLFPKMLMHWGSNMPAHSEWLGWKISILLQLRPPPQTAN